MKRKLLFLTLASVAFTITIVHSFMASEKNKKNILLDYNTANADAVSTGEGITYGEGGPESSSAESSAESGAAEGCGGAEGGEGGK